MLINHYIVKKTKFTPTWTRDDKGFVRFKLDTFEVLEITMTEDQARSIVRGGVDLLSPKQTPPVPEPLVKDDDGFDLF